MKAKYLPGADRQNPVSDRGESQKPRSWWQWFLMYPAIGVAFFGAVPTLFELYRSFDMGVQYGTTRPAEEQKRLWEKNFECSKETRQIVRNEHNVEVAVTVCPSGDVLVVVKIPGDQNPTYRWVALETFTAQAYWPGNGNLYAAENRSRDVLEPYVVICQKWLPGGYILRRVRLGERCLDQVVNPYNGKVLRQTPAPCECD